MRNQIDRYSLFGDSAHSFGDHWTNQAYGILSIMKVHPMQSQSPLCDLPIDCHITCRMSPTPT